MARYTFSHYLEDQHCGTHPTNSQTTKSVEFDEDALDPWTAVLAEFTNFLSGIYGYDISEQVFVKQYGHDEPITVSQARSDW